jgi:phosphoserine phosphatase
MALPLCAVASTKLICFDCDSTLSSIEGIDELARMRGPEVFEQVEHMTTDAMEGRIRVEQVFARRLEIIRPSRADIVAVGRRYVETMEPTAESVLSVLQTAGWTPVIVSGGFTAAIEPLAARLKISRIEAVKLKFDAAGEYEGFDENFPTTRSGGKPEVITRLQAEMDPMYTVMVGDGMSDLETKPLVDSFIGFGRYVVRPRVKGQATAFVESLADILALLP